MKIPLLLFRNGLHHKNADAIRNYPDFEITESHNPDDIPKFQYIYSPNHPIDVKLYPQQKFVFGPHFSVFPESNLPPTFGPHSIYIHPSLWAAQVWSQYYNIHQIPILPLPFGVDINKFQPIPSNPKTEVFLYYKNRSPQEFHFLSQFLSSQNISFRVFDCNHRYSEQDYLHCLQHAKFGVILDAHESQGFAIEEALSCNIPLFVWSVTNTNQVYGYNFPSAPATTVPYWDNRCGEVVYQQEDIITQFPIFLSNVEQNIYQPRQYILENLTRDICSQKMKDLFLSIP
jgi:hypothetical protein